jgi:hypothetical protein
MVEVFLSSVGALVIVTFLAMFAWDIVTRRWDALSWRNLFLLGFAHFFGLGCWFMGRGYSAPGVPVRGEGFMSLALGTALFMALFLVTCWIFFPRRWITKPLPKVELPITGPALIGAVVLLLTISFLGATIVQMSYSGALVAFLRGQIAATAVGLATYYFIARRFNPLAWSLFVGTVLMAVLIGIVGSSGRRSLLGCLLAIPWMWYFTVWRYRGASANFVRVGVGVLLGFLAVLVYTPLRFENVGKGGLGATLETRALQIVDLVQHPLEAVNSQVVEGLIYSDAAPNSAFIIENYPDPFGYKPFAGAVWMVANPIPRALWGGKPEALGIILQQQMHAPSNLGPGIIGHGWAEGGFLGIALYAVFFGAMAAAIDRALAERAWNPYFVAAIGSNLGNVFGLARGDTPLFLLEFLSGVIVSFLLLTIFKWAFGPIVSAFEPLIVYGAPAAAATEVSEEQDNPQLFEDTSAHPPAGEHPDGG